LTSAGIEYFTESKVESVDIKSKSLKLAKGGEDITYDKLIIATGSTVRLCQIALSRFEPWTCCSECTS